MLKTIILILCLLLFFPTQKTYGQAIGAVLVIPIKIAAIIFGVAFDLSRDTCGIHSHPGDYYYEKNYKIIKLIDKKIIECHDNCLKKLKKKDRSVTYRSARSGIKHGGCYMPCLTEAMKSYPTSVATCAFKESDDYYTDGSYYRPQYNKSAWLSVIFTNKHKLRNKYEKTDWQKARDECMELTSKKTKYFEAPILEQERLIALYNDCLKERGF